MPVAVTHASMYPESTADRLVAEIQTTTSTAPDRHSVSASNTAIWVLPDAPSQFCLPSANSEPGTSAMVEPGTRASRMPRAVSGRSLNPSANGGISPTRNRTDCSVGIPPEGTARNSHLFGCVETSSERSINNTGRFRHGEPSPHRDLADPTIMHVQTAHGHGHLTGRSGVFRTAESRDADPL